MNVELFPCSGGMAEGFRRAGITLDWAFDWDADACDSYEHNLGHRPIQMDVRDLVRLAKSGWRPGEPIRLLVADPPCTPWSRAGKRLGTEDERDMLRETADLIALWKPEAALIGNVPGLNDSTHWHVVQEVIGGLAQYGYCVVDYWQGDAANFGVPQRRVRPFWYVHQSGPCMVWPTPTHGDPAEIPVRQEIMPGMGVAPLKPWVTCRQALGHLPLEELGRPVRLRWKDGHKGPNHRPSSSSSPARTVTGNTHSDGSLLVGDVGEGRLVGSWENGNHLPSEADKPALTVMAAGEQSASSVLVLRPSQGLRVGEMDAPAMTLDAKPSRVGCGASHVLSLGPPADGHPPAHADAPSPTIRGGGDGHSAPQVVLVSSRHPPSEEDAPSMCERGSDGTHAILALESPLYGPLDRERNADPVSHEDSPAKTLGTNATHPSAVLTINPKHPPSSPSSPSSTIAAKERSQSEVLEWPWDRPSTTVCRDERIPPPGHKEGGSYLSQPDAVVLSEKARAILQGFPDGWVFSGATKKSRSAQIGMAMPPPLAEAVARSVQEQMRRVDEERLQPSIVIVCPPILSLASGDDE